MSEIKATMQKLKKENHYFRVDSKIKKVQIGDTGALSKTALLIYLLHCRSINEKTEDKPKKDGTIIKAKKNMGCSAAGYNKAKECIGVCDKKTYDKLIKKLEEKHLVKIRQDFRVFYGNVNPIEVLKFPVYNNQYKTFKPLESVETYRTYGKEDKYIQIPSVLIDSGALKNISINAIKTIFRLYDELMPIGKLGIDFKFIHAINTKEPKGYKRYLVFGDGFKKGILYKNECVEAIEPDKYILGEEEELGEEFINGVNELVQEGIFELVPVILKQDSEDSDNNKIEKEIFKGIIQFTNMPESKEKYLIVKPEDRERVIWILRPKYFVINPEYEKFEKYRAEMMENAKKLYNFDDVGTREDTKREYLQDVEFWNFIVEYKEKHFEDKKNYEDVFDTWKKLIRGGTLTETGIREYMSLFDNYSFFSGYSKYKENKLNKTNSFS